MRARQLLLVALFLLIGSQRGYCLSKSVINRLHTVSQQHYNGGVQMYSVLLYRGKAYAATRGRKDGQEVVAVWEYVPNDWHMIFDYATPPPHPKEVSERYDSYGFTDKLKKKLLGNWKKF